MYHIFIHSSVNGHLDCFYVLAIVNSAALNYTSIFLKFKLLYKCKAFFLYFFFFFGFIYLFIYLWLSWVFIAARRLSLVAASRGYSLLRCMGFSSRWLLLLRNMGSRRASFSSCGSRPLERRLSSCGARAQLLRSMWDLPGPGIEPVSPALAGGLPTTAPPGKPLYFNLKTIF